MLDDKEIIKLFEADEANQAFNLLMRKYSERLYWHIRRLTNSHEDANDILQEVWVKIWKNISLFRGESRLYTWVYRIATNEALSYLKKARIRNFFSFVEEEPALDRIEADPYFNGDDLQKRLYLAVKKLPQRQQLIFNLKYFEEMKYEEISKIVGGSIGSLKASYHHAYTKITKHFESEE